MLVPSVLLPKKPVQAVSFVLVVSLIFRAFLAALIPLGTDEAYALAVGRSFSLSFFDHPPIGFWLPALMEVLTTSVEPFFIRVPSLVLGSVSLFLMYRIGRFFGGAQIGLLAMTCMAVSPVSLLGGVLMLPDAPLYTGLLAACYSLLLLIYESEKNWRTWVFGGISVAFALASKYQAGLFVIAIFLWVVSSADFRHWLWKLKFWIAVAVASVGLMPVLYWNFSHEWVSFKFHTGRAGGGISALNFSKMLIAQLIYVFPTVMILALIGVFRAESWSNPKHRLSVFLGLTPIVLFNAVYLVSSNTLPHWTLPGWLMLIPLAALVLSRCSNTTMWRFVVWPGIALNLVFLVAALHLKWGVLTSYSTEKPSWDRTAPLVDVGRLRDVLYASGYLEDVDFVMANNWIDAGYISTAIGGGKPVRVESDKKHHFAFMKGEEMFGPTHLIEITTLDRADIEAAKLLEFARELDKSAAFPKVIPFERGEENYFAVILVSLTLDEQFQN